MSEVLQQIPFGGHYGMKRKSVTVMLSLMLVFSLVLAACADNNKNEPAASPSSTSSPKASESPAVEPEKPTKITIMLPLNIAETPPDTVEKEIERLTNTELTYQFFPADTYEERLNASFATGSLPQVTYLKNQATFLLMKDAIRDGQFWEIGPMLSEFPNLSKMKEFILNNTSISTRWITSRNSVMAVT
jgi:putative aldouronate transport system substrate-binding protein